MKIKLDYATKCLGNNDVFHLYNILVYARMSVVLFIMWKKGITQIPQKKVEWINDIYYIHVVQCFPAVKMHKGDFKKDLKT